MSEWTGGYSAALTDLERLIESRFSAAFPTRFRKAIAELLTDLRGDAAIIDHEHLNRQQRADLAAEAAERRPRQEALL